MTVEPDDRNALVCVSCGARYPANVLRCAADGTPLVSPASLATMIGTPVAPLPEVASDGPTIVDRVYCATCARSYPPAMGTCPVDGTPLVLPETLIEIFGDASGGGGREPPLRPPALIALVCVACHRSYPLGTKRCPRHRIPLVPAEIADMMQDGSVGIEALMDAATVVPGLSRARPAELEVLMAASTEVAPAGVRALDLGTIVEPGTIIETGTIIDARQDDDDDDEVTCESPAREPRRPR